MRKVAQGQILRVEDAQRFEIENEARGLSLDLIEKDTLE